MILSPTVALSVQSPSCLGDNKKQERAVGLFPADGGLDLKMTNLVGHSGDIALSLDGSLAA